jgi:hypothetical protein
MKIVSESTEELFNKLLATEVETASIRSAIERINKMPERERFWEHNVLLRLHERLFAEVTLAKANPAGAATDADSAL